MAIINDNELDLGSIVVTDSGNKTHLEFEGLSEDFSKLQAASLLPALSKMATGSSCFLYDTSEYYKYEKTSKTWYKISPLTAWEGGNY